MKIVILGAGAVGLQLAKQLIDEKKDVVLIERDPEQARLASNRLDCLVVNKPGNTIEALRDAETATADFFIAVTDSDEVNLIACALAANEFSVPFKIARVRNIDYSSEGVSEKAFLGIDYIVNPELVATRAIIKTIEHGAISDIMLFERSKAQMRHLTVEPNSPLAGQTLAQVGGSIDIPFLVAIVLRDKRFIIPDGRTRIMAGDILYVVATESDFDKLYERLGKHKTELRKIVIVGGGKIGTSIASHLLNSQRTHRGLVSRLFGSLAESRIKSVKIVDRDYARCKELSTLLPEALVIHGDISDEGVFEEEHFANSDLVIAVTGNQELNLVTAIYAKSIGMKRSVALVNKTNYTRIASQLGIDVPVSLKNSMVNSILKIVRRSNVKSVHSIPEGELEVMEILVDGNSSAVGKEISEIRLPGGALIVSILHDDQTHIPHGSYVVQGGDHLVIITRLSSIEQIQRIFTTSP
ncbi:MAG: Trk system potassium transporter TrkA [Spirochaetales bacterium]